MHLTLKNFIIFSLALITSACLTGKQGSKYVSYIDPLTADGVQPLLEGEKPKFIKSLNIEQDKTMYLKKNFVMIGEAHFKSYEEPRYIKFNPDPEENKAIKQAMKIRATHVLFYRKKIDEIFKSWLVPPEWEDIYENHTVYMVKRVK